ncbi:MAG: outer membrane protein [Sphingomicrobium sp.]
MAHKDSRAAVVRRSPARLAERTAACLLVALLASAASTEAQARDRSAYVELGGGLLWLNDMNYGFEAIGLDDFATIQHKTGYDFSGAAGYDFGMFRAELELGHKRAAVKQVDINGVVVGSPTDLELDASGHTSVTSAMLNLMLDVGRDDGLSGSIGGGFGWANAHNETRGPMLSSDVEDSQSTMAFQLIAAARYPISRTIDAGIKYRYFQTRGNLDFDGRVKSTGGPFRISDGRWSSHSLLLTLAINFNGR